MNEYTTHSKLPSQKLFISLLIIFISISTIYLLAPKLQVHASEGGVNGGQTNNDKNTGSTSRKGGASETKTGIFIYFASKNDGIPLTAGLLIVRDSSGAVVQDKSGLVTKQGFGKLNASFSATSTTLPYPVLTKGFPNGDFKVNGDAVREWLETPKEVNGADVPYYLYLVNQGSFGNIYYGKDGDKGLSVYESLMQDSDHVVLVVMPVAWMNVYKNGEYTSKVFMGTADGWAAMYSAIGYPKGDKITNQMTHQYLPASMVLQKEFWGLSPHAGEGLPNKLTYDEISSSGWDMFIIELPAKDQNTTCDEPEQPKPHPAPNESTGTTTIIKNYRTVDKTGKMVSDDGCFKTEQVSNRIDIEEEEEYKVVGFKISTTVQDNIPSETWETVVPAVTRQGDKPETVELTTPETCLYVLLEKSDDNINTWDRPLNDIPGPAPDHPSKSTLPQLSIVKNYRTKDSTTGTIISDDGCFIRKNVVPGITIDDEPEYKVVGWKVSTTTQDNIDSIAWNPPGTISQTGTTKGSTSLDETKNEVCLYVLLEKESIPTQPSNYNYILPQSRITRRIWLSAPENPLSEQIQTHEFIWHIDEHSPDHCTGHTHTIHVSCSNTGHSHNGCSDPNCTRTHHCGGHDQDCTDYCTGWKYMDRGLNLSLYNIKKLNYEDIVATKQEWVKGTGEVDHTKGFIKSYVKDGAFNRGNSETDASAQDYRETNWDYICVLHRGQDVLTLLEYKNQSLPGASAANTELRDVNSKGYKVANTDSGTRQLTVYYDKFSVELVNDTTTPGYDIRTVYGPGGSAPHTGAKCGYTTKEVVLTTPLALNDIGVKVEVYSGSQAGGKDNVTSGLPSRTGTSVTYKGENYSGKTRGVMISSGATISFRPYIQMQYDTITNIDKKAYVIGEYQRKITTNDYAEIGYASSRGGSLNLSSLQWSTHKSSNGKKVLPGGAALSLSIPNNEHRFVRITTYQTIIDGAGKEQIDRIGGSYSGLQTQSDAKSSHDSLVATVKDALEKLNMQQWVNKNGGNPFDGIAVDNYENTDIRALGNGARDGKVSMDSKYYFSNDNGTTPASEGDLDVTVAAQDSSLIYTFFTNTKGEVRVVLNDVNAPLTNESAGTLLYTINANDTEWDKGNTFTGGNDLVSDAKCINQRTQIVDKLIQAVEAGTGYDAGIPGKANAPSWRSPYWYNEAFDGISVVVDSTVLEVGFMSPSERQIVLDPKLIPLQTSQSNMNTDSTYSSGFKTKDYTPVYQSQPGQVGEFRGARIDLADMDTFFSTRGDYFNIPNQTVQDLH